MAFWGVYLKPNEPYTLPYDDAVSKRLRITQATLGDATRNSPARSVVRCSVGDKSAIAICSLSIRELTCCQLELEFEESQDIIFSVMGPRGVYLAGYLITPAPTAHQHPIDCKGQRIATTEIGGSSDHDLHQDELGFNKGGPVKESTDADIGHCDKNIKSGKRLLKCISDKNKQGKIIITLDRQMGKDTNEDTGFGTHDKYMNQKLCSCDEEQEKTIGVKSYSMFGRLLEERRDAIEKKKRKRKRKRKLSNSEATATDLRDALDSGVTEEKRSSPYSKEMKKNKRKDTLDDDEHHNTGQINGFTRVAIIGDGSNLEKQRPAFCNVEYDSSGKVKSREPERKISKIVFTKKIIG